VTTRPYSKPLPQPDPDTQAFWDGCKAHELRVLRCDRCGAYIHYPAPICHRCTSTSLTWTKLSGRGTVFTYIVVHAPNLPGFAEEAPYVVAWIELAEQPGLKMISNVVGCRPSEVTVGMPVRVTFEDATPEISIPRFVPAG